MQSQKHLVLKILLTVVVVIAILLVVAEFGLRWYLSSSIKDEAASDPTIQSSEVDVDFGSTPLLFGLPRGTVPQLTISVPNSVQITYPNGDDRPPEVSGSPASTLTMKDLNVIDEVAGTMIIDASLTSEYLLASAQKSAVETNSADGSPAASPAAFSTTSPAAFSTTSSTGSSKTSSTMSRADEARFQFAQDSGAPSEGLFDHGELPSLADLFGEDTDADAATDAFREKLSELTRRYLKVTAIHPNPSNGTLTFEIAHGVASLELQPGIEDGRLAMHLNDMRFLGFSIPETMVNEMRKGLEEAASVDMEPFHPTKVEVTSRGLHIVQEGKNVDLRQLQNQMSAVLPGGNATSGQGTTKSDSGTKQSGYNTRPAAYNTAYNTAHATAVTPAYNTAHATMSQYALAR